MRRRTNTEPIASGPTGFSNLSSEQEARRDAARAKTALRDKAIHEWAVQFGPRFIPHISIQAQEELLKDRTFRIQRDENNEWQDALPSAIHWLYNVVLERGLDIPGVSLDHAIRFADRYHVDTAA